MFAIWVPTLICSRLNTGWEKNMPRINTFRGPAAVTAGLALTLALGGTPIAALAEGTNATPQAVQSADAAGKSDAATDAAKATDAADATADAKSAADDNAATTDAQPAAANNGTNSPFTKTGKTWTINKTTSENLTVDEEGVTVTAAKDVVYTGTITVKAKNVTVDGVHFLTDASNTAGGPHDNISVDGKTSGAKVMKCTFDISKDANVKKQHNGVRVNPGAKNITFDTNFFNIATHSNAKGASSDDKWSWCGINLVGGANAIDNVKVINNTLNAQPGNPVPEGGTASSTILLVGNGNVGTEGSYGIKNLAFEGNHVYDHSGLASDKSRINGALITNVDGAAITKNDFEGRTGISHSIWPGQGPSVNVTVEGNTFNTTVGISFGSYTDTKTHEVKNSIKDGVVTLGANNFGANTKPVSGIIKATTANGKAYLTLNAAIEAAKDGETVTLQQNVEEDVTVPGGKKVVINLNGHTLTNSKGGTVTNTDSLTIRDSTKAQKVTFDSKGGSAVAVQEVTYGDAASKPADPTRAGYTFAGWYADEALTKAYDFDEPVTSDLTLYAGWRKVGGSGGTTETPEQPKGEQKPEAKKQDAKKASLPKTGDDQGAAALAAGAAGVAAVAAGVAVVQRRRKE